ncbi:MAG: hypothetical protein JNL87_13350 [Burkholderiaceae bacterium]|nr:hypothetical protein [Burkholderiaceae bacterium]
MSHDMNPVPPSLRSRGARWATASLAAVALLSLAAGVAVPAMQAFDDDLLWQHQGRAEIDLLMAEAMWGEVPAAYYEPQLIRVDQGGRQRLALVDPTGVQPPTWVREEEDPGPCPPMAPAGR